MVKIPPVSHRNAEPLMSRGEEKLQKIRAIRQGLRGCLKTPLCKIATTPVANLAVCMLILEAVEDPGELMRSSMF
jgi:hypothetical protein